MESLPTDEPQDERRPLVITVEEGRAILGGRTATAGRGPRGLVSRSGSLTTRTNMTTQIVILPVMLSMHGGCVLTGLVLGALLNSLAGQVALCDPPEPNAAEAQ